MLTREDIDDLFDLLAIFRPNDKHLNDQRLKAAWHLVLEPYGKDEVRNAIGMYFRERRFWPDVTEIATRCPPPVIPQRSRAGSRQINPEANDLYFRWKPLVEKRQNIGVPATIQDAQLAGLSNIEWLELLEKMGLNFDLQKG